MKYFKHTKDGFRDYYMPDTAPGERTISFHHVPGNKQFDEMMEGVAAGTDEIEVVDGNL